MDENDPLWYDRAEPDEPAGRFLNALAWVSLVLVGIVTAARAVYWLPDRVWQRASGWIGRRVAAGGRRS